MLAAEKAVPAPPTLATSITVLPACTNLPTAPPVTNPVNSPAVALLPTHKEFSVASAIVSPM